MVFGSCRPSGPSAPRARRWSARRSRCPSFCRGAHQTFRIHRPNTISLTADMAQATMSAPFRLSDAPTAPELVAKYFRGLGDPTRLRILDLLPDEGELAVGRALGPLGLPQATVSTHLGCLRWCGFVATHREQRAVIYRIADKRVRAIVALGHELLRDNVEHVAACGTIDAPC